MELDIITKWNSDDRTVFCSIQIAYNYRYFMKFLVSTNKYDGGMKRIGLLMVRRGFELGADDQRS